MCRVKNDTCVLDPLLASAGIDRICHRGEILVVQGDSFRAQGRQLLAGQVLIVKAG